MSKAIFVMDEMPDTCRRCDLCDDQCVCAKTKKNIPLGGARPDWCPLKEMPEYRDDPWQNWYKLGWNACLKAIGGLDE